MPSPFVKLTAIPVAISKASALQNHMQYSVAFMCPRCGHTDVFFTEEMIDIPGATYSEPAMCVGCYHIYNYQYEVAARDDGAQHVLCAPECHRCGRSAIGDHQPHGDECPGCGYLYTWED